LALLLVSQDALDSGARLRRWALVFEVVYPLDSQRNDWILRGEGQ
jgi:hypothetical protein